MFRLMADGTSEAVGISRLHVLELVVGVRIGP